MWGFSKQPQKWQNIPVSKKTQKFTTRVPLLFRDWLWPRTSMAVLNLAKSAMFTGSPASESAFSKYFAWSVPDRAWWQPSVGVGWWLSCGSLNKYNKWNGRHAWEGHGGVGWQAAVLNAVGVKTPVSVGAASASKRPQDHRFQYKTV